MATARELLEQADALMRRNRAHLDDDIPVLTEAVAVADEHEPETRPAPATVVAAGPGAPLVAGAPLAAPTMDDIPLLTDAVEEIEALSIQESVDSEGEPSDWLDIGRNDASVIGDAPDSIAMVPPVARGRHPTGPGDAENPGSAISLSTEATVIRADAHAEYSEGGTARAGSAAIGLADLGAAGGRDEVESAVTPAVEPAGPGTTEALPPAFVSSGHEWSSIASTVIEPSATEFAEIESAEIDTAESDPAESDPAESDPAESDPAESDPAESDPAERETVEAVATELELADVEFAEPEPAPRAFAAVEPEPVERPEAGLPAVAFAGGSFGISVAEDADLVPAAFDEVEYTGEETADEEITPAAADDEEFTAEVGEAEEITGAESAEVSTVGPGLPSDRPHGVAAPVQALAAADTSDVTPVAAATTLLARGAAALLHGARALLGGHSSAPSAAPTPATASIESASLRQPDAAPAPGLTSTPLADDPLAMDTLPFEGMSPESAIGMAALEVSEASHAGTAAAAAHPSEAAVPVSLADESGSPTGLADPGSSDPAATPPVETDTAPLSVSAGVPSDTAQWEAMAEEIRMQVLQRIDLFTDTGLRAQLGARLQPVVDRASADLVATINQHVGEILRAYVAEAIEREIDNWRRDH